MINYIKKLNNKPIWVAGTSGGCFSAINIAINFPDEIDGLLISSCVTTCDDERNLFNIREKYPNGILDMELNKISLPTHLMVHQKDACIPTPPEKAKLVQQSLTSSSNLKFTEMSGGKRASRSCSAHGYHGFYGIEEKATSEMISFISQN